MRVSFSTNDERTAKRVSDALGATTEQRAMKNYAGNRLSPWLGHLMVSRQETSRPLLTPGEIMQLPPSDELVMISGTSPIRAKKARYYEDGQFRKRLFPAPKPITRRTGGAAVTASPNAAGAWNAVVVPPAAQPSSEQQTPALPDHANANPDESRNSRNMKRSYSLPARQPRILCLPAKTHRARSDATCESVSLT